MENNQTVVRKRVAGAIEFNDGEFSEIQTIGMEGIENNLILETLKIHHSDTENPSEEFQRRFPVGMRLGIVTTTEIDENRASETATGASRVGAGRN